MRRRTGPVPLAVVGSLLAILVLSPQGATSGEQIFNANLASTNNTYPLSWNESAAQSFVPTTSFVLYNVTIRVGNVGTKGDSLNLTIQTDAGGVPSDVIIAGSDAGQSGSSWLDFPMHPRPTLTSGVTYWIVARNGMSAGEGYDWHHSNADAVPGQAKQNLGAGWVASEVTDFTYETYGLAVGAGVTPTEVPLSWVLLAAALVAPPVGYGLWRRRPKIEEVFLVHRQGLLLCHFSRRMRAHQDKDDDILTAMLTVVQDFVRDSFRYEKNRDLDRIEFGSYRVLIERGRYAYLAAAFSGRDSPETRRKLRRILNEVEGNYGTDLARFDGNMEPLIGVRDIVGRLIRAV